MNKGLLKKTCFVLSWFSLGAGALGMLYCVNILWLASVKQVTVAGLPFVAGAILFGSGLISLTILIEK